MKKRILSVALVVAMATTMFAGCGKKSDKEVKDAVSGIDVKAIDFKTNQQLTSDKVELTVWESTGGPDKFIEAAGKCFTNYIQISQSNTLMLSQEMLTQKSY